jgi:hypothetical protein
MQATLSVRGAQVALEQWNLWSRSSAKTLLVQQFRVSGIVRVLSEARLRGAGDAALVRACDSCVVAPVRVCDPCSAALVRPGVLRGRVGRRGRLRVARSRYCSCQLLALVQL